MLLTWLGTAGFRVETAEGAIFLIDPFLSRPKEARPVLPIQLTDLFPVDEIFLTHGRFDHALDTPALVEQTGALVHAPTPVEQKLAELGVSTHSLQPIKLKKVKRVGSLSWTAIPGRVNQLDASPSLRALIRNPAIFPEIQTLDQQWPLGGIVAYLFRTNAYSMIHFGSAGWVDGEIGHLQPDIALLPVESRPTKYSNSVRLTSILKPKIVIPHHWDDYYPSLSKTIDLSDFEAIVQAHAPNTKVHMPVIGQPFSPARLIS